MSIESKLKQIREELPAHCRLVAISKTQTPWAIMEAYQAGQRLFGENKVQELVPKFEQLPKDIEWHLVGHLQSNKVKYIAPFVSMIHSVDSLTLLQEINKQAAKNNRIITCLLQVHIAMEESKFGLSEEELTRLVEMFPSLNMQNVTIGGLMGMATNTDNEATIRNEFQNLKQLFDRIKTMYFAQSPNFCELSMGMSSDFHIAVQQGSTLVRVGSSIFGERMYV
jgi:pyridoxal phosphate enzyme (YggS family)